MSSGQSTMSEEENDQGLGSSSVDTRGGSGLKNQQSRHVQILWLMIKSRIPNISVVIVVEFLGIKGVNKRMVTFTQFDISFMLKFSVCQ